MYVILGSGPGPGLGPGLGPGPLDLVRVLVQLLENALRAERLAGGEFGAGRRLYFVCGLRDLWPGSEAAAPHRNSGSEWSSRCREGGSCV